jgi:hypothetical protein
MSKKEQITVIEAAIEAAQTIQELEAIDIPTSLKTLFKEDMEKKASFLAKRNTITFEVAVASTLLWDDSIDPRKFTGSLASVGDIQNISVRIGGNYTPVAIEKVQKKLGDLTQLPIKGVKTAALMKELRKQERGLRLQPQQGVVYLIEVNTNLEDIKFLRVENLNPMTMKETPYLEYLSVERPIGYTLQGVASGRSSDLDQGFESEEEALEAFSKSQKRAKDARQASRRDSSVSEDTFDNAFENGETAEAPAMQPLQPEEASEVV